MKKIILSIALATTFVSVFAQKINTPKLDSLFNLLETNNKSMGSIAFFENGKISYKKAIGFSNTENKIKATSETKYRIGSISKMFTATLIMKAVEENKLNLNESIEKYFPTIENAKIITVSNLLNHRSGIASFTEDSTYLEWNTMPKTETELIKTITNLGSYFKPDSTAEYSNSNYVLLTFMLQKIYNKPYKQLLKEKIADKIGLTNTFFGGKINTTKNEAKSYKYMDNWEIETETNMSIPQGAGAVVSTASDLTKFINALFAGKIITPKSLKTMTTLKDTYGYGIFDMNAIDTMCLGHTGGIDGFSSILMYSPTNKLSIAYVSNANNYSNNKIIKQALNIYYNKPSVLPEFKNYIIKPEDLEIYLGEYSSTQIPIKITITKNNATLMAQATGQPQFPLTAIEKNIFVFDKAGVKIEFVVAKNELILKQGGQVFTFSKEK